MLWILLLAAVLATVCVGAVRRSSSRAGKEAGHAPVRPGAVSAPDPAPRTLEGKLTLELVRGKITGRQYRQAMSIIAVRDIERNPLEMPPDIAPPGPV
jgi:hypothetical protein